MSYFLQPLLRIRAMREDRAAGELTVARRAVAEAERKLERTEENLVRINDKIEDCAREVNRIVEKNEGGVRYDPQYKKEFISDLLEIIKKHTE